MDGSGKSKMANVRTSDLSGLYYLLCLRDLLQMGVIKPGTAVPFAFPDICV